MSETTGDIDARRDRRFAWITGASLVGALLLVGLLAEIRAASAWRDVRRRLDARIKEYESRDATRPVLRGASQPGNAWKDYDLALDKLSGEWPETQSLDDLLQSEISLDGMAEAVKRAESALNLMMRGASRSSGNRPEYWFRLTGRRFYIRQTDKEILLAVLAQWKAKMLRAEGRHVEAAQVLLDVCQFGRDVAFNALVERQSLGMDLYSLGLGGLRDLIVGGPVPAEALREARDGLEILDRSLPPASHTILNESLSLPYRCAYSEEWVFEQPEVTRSWSHGLSKRLLLADVVAHVERCMAPVSLSDSMSWKEAQETFRRIEAELNARKDLPAGRLVTYGFRTARYARTTLANLRLLRLACSFLLTGEIPELADPFGGRLVHTLVGGRLKVWSVGPDGVDNGGNGGLVDDEPLDLVLECSR